MHRYKKSVIYITQIEVFAGISSVSLELALNLLSTKYYIFPRPAFEVKLKPSSPNSYADKKKNDLNNK